MGARLVAGLTIPVAEILGHPGTYREFRIREPLEGVATALARLDSDSMDAALRAESVVEGVLVTGKVHGGTTLTCARCLKEFGAPIDLDVCELFAAPGQEPTDSERLRERRSTIEDPDDTYFVEGMEINLEPMLRDVVTLALPLNPHCKEDCTGLCANCGRELVEGACDCTKEERDPRWAELDALKERLG